MKLSHLTASIAALLVATGMFVCRAGPGEEKKEPTTEVAPVGSALSPASEKGIEWIVKAQHENGGWGAGSHARQNIRDPHGVETDPATTAFTTMTLLRAGHTPTSGAHKDAVRKAVGHLVDLVERSPDDGPRVTELQGTQIQAKLGPLVDTAMTAQLLARVLPLLPADDRLRNDVDAALEKCVAKLQKGQAADGSWGGGGWAPVLQSSLATGALELAQASGKKVDQEKLDKARDHQKRNFDAGTGRAAAADAAGIELYALSGATRAGAGEARVAREAVERAQKEGKVAPGAPVNEETLKQAGVLEEDAKRLARAESENRAQQVRMADAQVQAGFGNNGGEEFLSFMLTSEAMVITGQAEWAAWKQKLEQKLIAIQNPDGSWSGHHCITSPVFCTAAAVQSMTADRDAELLRKVVKDVSKGVQQHGK